MAVSLNVKNNSLSALPPVSTDDSSSIRSVSKNRAPSDSLSHRPLYQELFRGLATLASLLSPPTGVLFPEKCTSTPYGVRYDFNERGSCISGAANICSIETRAPQTGEYQFKEVPCEWIEDRVSRMERRFSRLYAQTSQDPFYSLRGERIEWCPDLTGSHPASAAGLKSKQLGICTKGINRKLLEVDPEEFAETGDTCVPHLSVKRCVRAGDTVPCEAHVDHDPNVKDFLDGPYIPGTVQELYLAPMSDQNRQTNG